MKPEISTDLTDHLAQMQTLPLQKSIYKARKLREANNADAKDYLKELAKNKNAVISTRNDHNYFV